MANVVMNNFKRALAEAELDLASVPIKIILTEGWVPDPDDKFVTASGAGAAEISVTGYTGGYGGGGREPLTSVTVTQNDTINKVVLDADDVVWASLAAGATPDYASGVIETGGSDATALVLFSIDIGSAPTAGAPFTIQWHTDGVLRW
jgi:hypothetical protein